METDLKANLEHLFTSKNNWDITFVVGVKELHAHKAILSTRSPVFRAMFQHDMKEAASNTVEIFGTSPDIFESFLRFFYTDQVDLTMENCDALLSAANQYLLDHLKWKCELFLAQNLTIENCCEFLVLSDINNASNLKTAAINCICKAPAEAMKTKGWKELMKSSRAELIAEVMENLHPA